MIRVADDKHPVCIICGTVMRNGGPYKPQTCGPACAAIMIVHPELLDHGRKTVVTDTRGGQRHERGHHVALADRGHFRDDMEQFAEHLLHTAKSVSVEEWFAGAESVRGIDSSDKDRATNPWAACNRIVVGLYLEPQLTTFPEASLVFEVPKGKRVRSWIKRELLGGKDNPHWDILLAWRCLCRRDHRVIYQSAEDLPDTEGYHDACPECGNAPLEVRRGL